MCHKVAYFGKINSSVITWNGKKENFCAQKSGKTTSLVELNNTVMCFWMMVAHSKCICNDPPTEGFVSWTRLQQRSKSSRFWEGGNADNMSNESSLFACVYLEHTYLDKCTWDVFFLALESEGVLHVWTFTVCRSDTNISEKRWMREQMDSGW